jgi:hypothetical protein
MGFLTKIRASVDVFAFLCRSFAALAIVLAVWANRLAYAEPAAGPRAEIVGARIGADRRAIATIKLSDAKGQPLDLDNLDSDSVKFTIAVIRAVKSGETSYHNYILTRVTGNEFVYKGETRKPALTATLQPDFDRGGVFTRVRPGIFTYTFKTALPADYDRHATHVIGGEFTREKGKFVANPLFEFVPSGAKVKMQRDVVETASCNNCHDPLKYHGGTRREAGYCALCHTPQLTDPETGESLEFKVFVHKIHRGKLLPSVREGKSFFIVGENQRVADFSTVRYPQALSSDGLLFRMPRPVREGRWTGPQDVAGETRGSRANRDEQIHRSIPCRNHLQGRRERG